MNTIKNKAEKWRIDETDKADGFAMAIMNLITADKHNDISQEDLVAGINAIISEAIRLGREKTIEKVYVVQSSHGQYEDYITEINGIYSRPDVAESEAQKIRDYYREILDGGYPSDKIEDWGSITEEEYERIYELGNLYYCASEYNQTWVTEFELDK